MHYRRRRNDHTEHGLAREHHPYPVFAVAEHSKHPDRREHEDHLPITSVNTSRPPPGKDSREDSKHSSSHDQPPAQRQDVLTPRPALILHHPSLQDQPDIPTQ